MIRINPLYLDRFKYFGNSYNYMVSNGVWLSFDKDTHEYVGIELFYFPYNVNNINLECDKKLSELLSKDLLELI